MIRLIKGNENKLEGRLISFSRLEDEATLDSERPIIALYCTQDMLEFIEKMKIPPSVAEELKNAQEKLYEDIQKRGEKIKIFSSYIAALPDVTQENLLSGTEDVLDMGTYLSVDRCMDATKLGVEIYTMNFEKQLLKKVGLLGKLDTKKNIAKPTLESYSLVRKDEMKKYLLENFVVPIMDSRIHKDENRARYISSDLVNFCKEAPFSSDIFELLEVLKNTRSNPQIVDDYLNKIEAIYSERYEIAAIFRDKIKNKK